MNKPAPDNPEDHRTPDLAGFGLDEPDDGWLDRLRRAEAPGPLGGLGSYELIEEVSRGAQGVVYRARRRDAEQVVALKRLLGGSSASPVMRARFGRELEAELGLSHPNIVTVHGMETAEGQTLLEMEWIDGRPVDAWARDGGSARTVREVLAVFVKICDAVHHAHQRGIIHRDLKPSNILVDAQGEPHVLDFGLAMLIGDDPSAQSRLTQSQGFVGTLAYASPEQVRGDPDGVDIRTDVYALGVLLYRLLTGATPYPVGTDVAALVDAIKTLEPVPPSGLDRRVDRELDAIVLKALAKDKPARYQSVEALGADVRRHLAGEPIEARRASAGYVLRKLALRHRVPVAVGLAFVVLLAAGLGTSLVLWRRAAVQHAQAAAVTGLLQELLKSADPIAANGPGYTVRQLLDDFSRGLDGRLKDQPEVEAAVRITIGDAYRGLGEFAAAEPHFKAALQIRRGLYGNRDPRTAESLEDYADALHELADLPGAEGALREALAIRQAAQGAEHPATAPALTHLSAVLRDQGRYADAEAAAGRSVAILRRQREPDPDVLRGALTELTASIVDRRDFDSAEPLLREALALAVRSHGEGDPDTAIAKTNLCRVLRQNGHGDEAEQLSREALAAIRAYYPGGHPQVAVYLNNLGAVLWSRGKSAEALPLMREALAIYEKVLGPEHPKIATVLLNIAAQHMSLGQPQEAEPLLRRALEIQGKTAGDRHEIAETLRRLGTVLGARGDLDGAESYYRQALDRFQTAFGEENPYAIETRCDVAAALVRKHDYAGADAMYRNALALGRKVYGTGDTRTADIAADMAVNLRSMEALPEAAALAGEAAQIYRRTPGTDDVKIAKCLATLGAVLLDQSDHAQAEEALRECWTIRQARLKPDDWLRFNTMSLLGAALAGQGKFDQAEPLLVGGFEGLRDKTGIPEERRTAALRRVIDLYGAWGKPEQAAAWREKGGAPADPKP